MHVTRQDDGSFSYFATFLPNNTSPQLYVRRICKQFQINVYM